MSAESVEMEFRNKVELLYAKGVELNYGRKAVELMGIQEEGGKIEMMFGQTSYPLKTGHLVPRQVKDLNNKKTQWQWQYNEPADS